MHPSLLLIALLALGACGKKETKKKPNYGVHFAKLEEASRVSMKVGTVALGRISGSTIGVNEYTARAVADSKSIKTKSIILKIEGDEYYSLDVNEDLIERKTERKVVLQKMFDQDMMKSLEEEGAEVSSDENFFRAKLAKVHADNQASAGLSVTQILNISIDLRATCNASMLQTITNIHGYVMGENYTLPDMHLDATSSCDTSPEALLSQEELRKLDLSNITFCDDRGEKEDCSAGRKNMRYLVD